MSRNQMKTGLLILLILLVISFSVSCQKLKISNLRANYYFNQANTAFSDGKYSRAIEEYEMALQYNPDLVQAYRYLGESYKQMYKPGTETEDNIARADKALEALKKALDIDPNNKEIIHSLADMYNKMRDFEEAEKLYIRILEMEPANLGNYYVVAEFYKSYAGTSTGDQESNEDGGDVPTVKTPFQKAEEMYLRRIETDPDNPQGYAYIAQFYDQITPIPEFDKAVEYHRRILELEPDNTVAYYAIGVNRFFKAYRLQNQLNRDQKIALGNEGEEALLKAIEIDPTYADPYAYMNILYRNVFANVYPDRRARYVEDADRYAQRFQEIRERELERKKLKRDLTRIE